MFDGFISVAALNPFVHVAKVEFNKKEIIDSVKEAAELNVKIAVLPELCVTGATCQDLFYSSALLNAAKKAVFEIAEATAECNMLFAIGFPFQIGSKIHNGAAVICKGKILGIVAKNHLSPRHESQFSLLDEYQNCNDPDIASYLCSSNTVFSCIGAPEITVSVGFGENPRFTPDTDATIILKLAASPEFKGNDTRRKNLLIAESSSREAAVLYSSAGYGESTADVVYGGYSIVCSPDEVLGETLPFSKVTDLPQVNLAALIERRKRNVIYTQEASYPEVIEFELELEEEELVEYVERFPFITDSYEEAEYILTTQAYGLARRMGYVGAHNLVLGTSGGLDSTLALIVCVRACDILGLDHSAIHALSMPGLGTSERTFDNARTICMEYGVRYDEISIVEACKSHFADIGHDENVRNVVYENAQARERTQILMDIANEENTFVVGTGDLSELALGWATYNGDHMSMYSVNASIPKTLVRDLVAHEAHNFTEGALEDALLDIVNTPISPELLPTDESGAISQVTEDKVGPYALHDFFIYHVLRNGMSPAQTFKLACKAFVVDEEDRLLDDNDYFTEEEICKWLRVFYRRFFTQQYKRSCMPDGPCATEVSVSPRAGFTFPSDVMSSVWMAELDKISVPQN